MKHHLLLALSLTTAFTHSIAQPQIKVNITAATIFLNGAELYSNARISLPQGESDMLFTNVAGAVNQQSLTIGAENGVVVQSATFQNNYLADSSLSPRAKKLQDSIARLEAENALLTDRKTVAERQLEVLDENKKVSGLNNGLAVAELQKLLDLLSARMAALLSNLRKLREDLEKREEKIALLRSQLEEEQKRAFQPGGQLLVKFYAPAATTTNVNMSYVVPNAGWTPAYDLRVDKVNEPVKLFYKANVHQNCGVRWSNIKVTLSTGNPSEGVEAPVLNPNYLSFFAPLVDFKNDRSNAIQMNRSQGLSLGGGRGTNTQYVIDGIKLEQTSGINNYTSVDNSGISTSFDIDLPYTIPGDGQQHTIAVKTYELPATYRYFAVPRIDKDAFLQAQVTQWENLSLLPGQTNVFFEGSYVGQGLIDMRNVRDTMNLSLGRDKKIIIRRERDKDVHSQKTIGTNERQHFAYTISVRNTRREKINLVIQDQVPVSNDKDIVVEEREHGSAQYDEATGSLRWMLDVKPAELLKVQLSYTVKYPKGKTVSNLK